MDYDVFISYSRKDTAVAERICAAFDKAGITYFIDRQGIGGGMEFPNVLAQAIIGCRKFLFLASAHSYVSKFTNKEIAFAFNKKERNSILPYRIDESEMPLALEFVFCDVNWRTIREHPIETVLVDDMLQMLGRDPRSAGGGRRYEVGDLYDENGRRGIVFETDASGRHGKIVSLRDAPSVWCAPSEYAGRVKTGATDERNGAENLRTIRRIAAWRELYPAFAWCADRGEGWYLPAVEELRRLYERLEVVSRSAEENGGDALAGCWYWSSSEAYAGDAWYADFNTGHFHYRAKNTGLRVRSVALF